MRRLIAYEFESSLMYVIQIFIEKILRKHLIDSSKDFYLKLSLPSLSDLVMVKYDDMILVNNDEFFLIFDFNQGQWFAKGYTYKGEDVVVSYYENGKRMVNPISITKFWALEKIFTRNIREQGWFENGVVIQNAIVNEVKLIEKNEPNPMRDISEYSKPEEYSQGGG